MRANSPHGPAHTRGSAPPSNQHAMEDTMDYQHRPDPAGAPMGPAVAQPPQVCNANNPNQAAEHPSYSENTRKSHDRGMNQAAHTSVTSMGQQEHHQPGILTNQGMGIVGPGEVAVAQETQLFEDHANAGPRIHAREKRAKELVESSGIPASSLVPSAFGPQVSTSSKWPSSTETPETNSPSLTHKEAISGQPRGANMETMTSPRSS